jgi:two-component system sensor histidine kinase FlrB
MHAAPAQTEPAAEVAPQGAARLSPADLAELLGAFNGVTARLEATHESLRGEVARLQGELATANRQLERAQRLAALGEMAAGIAHEVRNPLGSIRLHARMLEQDLADRPGERGVTLKILAAVNGLEAVVSDVLAFSKEFRVRASLCDASDLLERALDEAQGIEAGRRAGASGASLPALVVVRRDLECAPVGVECDAGLVHRALVNVVRNAIEAMTPEAHERGPAPSRRELTLGVREERLPGADGAGVAMCVFSVADTGPGMTREVMERMFNPFFTTRAAGTGLGLSIVHRIADAHRGLVRVRNKDTGSGEGRGAVVEVLLPARRRGEDGAGDQGGAGGANIPVETGT